MRRLKIALLFISLFTWRWVGLASPLPSTWTPDSLVRFTAPIIDIPEQTDTKTIVRSGIWYIPLAGYAEIMPGSLVSFIGRVETKVLLGQETRIVMAEPTFEEMTEASPRRLSLVEHLLITLGKWRRGWVVILEKNFPEPMSSLAAGILLGVRQRMPQDFYQQLVTTGTLHIVAASGFNVMIVASVLMVVAGQIWRRGVAIVVGVVGIVVYVLLAGASASVVRAGIMGSLTLIAYYLGRPAEAKRLLWISAGAMLLIHPLMLVDIGFQLSVAATAGILYFVPLIERVAISHTRYVILKDYLYPTLAATLATAPVILYHFGRVSWISPLVNMLILPVIPLIMGLSALVLVGGPFVAWLAYVPLWWVVAVIRWWG